MVLSIWEKDLSKHKNKLMNFEIPSERNLVICTIDCCQITHRIVRVNFDGQNPVLKHIPRQMTVLVQFFYSFIFICFLVRTNLYQYMLIFRCVYVGNSYVRSETIPRCKE